MSDWYDRNGSPIPVSKVGDLLADPAYKVVRQDHVGDKFVSTVWLGLDHSFTGTIPLIFETMVFGGSWEDEQCDRYPTEAAALAGHDQIVASLGGNAQPCGRDCADPSHAVREAARIVASEQLRGWRDLL